MPNKRTRKKRLNRATPTYVPGGATMYVPAGYKQGVYNQTFYGGSATVPVGQQSLFSPGEPLPVQPGVNPGGYPVQFRFPTAYNSFPVDRQLGDQESPAFDVLRRLAMMDYGIGMCERYWLDMVPKMVLKVVLKNEYTQAGAEEKDYKAEIKFFKDFFSKPDGVSNFHEWIQQALIEQSQIDELYIYKNRNRGGKLLGLQIIDGSQMKPLLDDWGKMPEEDYAYQQYPWGIPGMQYYADQIIHRRETPSVYTPYGRSRVERVLLITNTALRKSKLDLSHFTEGNIPAGLLTPPEGSQWTPDLLDSYEQSWNALIAGNLQQLARVKVTQPGFTYTPFIQPSFDAVIDRYWLNIRASAYGIPMDELGFTETSNRSTGQTQQDVVYRRTIGPLAAVYASIFTSVMNCDFPPAMHGEMFEVQFGGYEEVEDESKKAEALSTYTGAGILGLSDAAKIAKLPVPPDAPYIGRVFFSKDGPIFLDDVAQDDMRAAAEQAQLAGYQLAANPPEPDTSQDEPPSDEKPPEQASSEKEQSVERVLASIAAQLQRIEGYYEQRTSIETESSAGSGLHHGRGNSSNARGATAEDAGNTGEERADPKEVYLELKRWKKRAIEDAYAKNGRRAFVSVVIPKEIQDSLAWELSHCDTPDEVRDLFSRAMERDASPKATAVVSGGSQQQSKSAWKLRW